MSKRQGFSKADTKRMCLSLETLEGLRITGKCVCVGGGGGGGDISCLVHNTSWVNLRGCECLTSPQTLLHAVKSFTELGPLLLRKPGVKYLLSEVFSQDPLEKYFSRQRHRGGGADNPTVEEFRANTATLIQQQSIYKDLKTMNIEASSNPTDVDAVCQPLPKRKRTQPNSQCM